MSKLYEDVIDDYGIKRRMSKSRDGTKWFGSIRFVGEDGKETQMWCSLPSSAVRPVAKNEKVA